MAREAGVGPFPFPETVDARGARRAILAGWRMKSKTPVEALKPGRSKRGSMRQLSLVRSMTYWQKARRKRPVCGAGEAGELREVGDDFCGGDLSPGTGLGRGPGFEKPAGALTCG